MDVLRSFLLLLLLKRRPNYLFSFIQYVSTYVSLGQCAVNNAAMSVV